VKAYLSHGHDTAAPAKCLSESLAHAGVEPIDPVGLLQPGEDRAEAIQRAVDEADATVFLVGFTTARQAVLAREWSTVLERSWSYPDKPLIPVVLAAVVCGFIPRSALESVSDLAGYDLPRYDGKEENSLSLRGKRAGVRGNVQPRGRLAHRSPRGPLGREAE